MDASGVTVPGHWCGELGPVVVVSGEGRRPVCTLPSPHPHRDHSSGAVTWPAVGTQPRRVPGEPGEARSRPFAPVLSMPDADVTVAPVPSGRAWGASRHLEWCGDEPSHPGRCTAVCSAPWCDEARHELPHEHCTPEFAAQVQRHRGHGCSHDPEVPWPLVDWARLAAAADSSPPPPADRQIELTAQGQLLLDADGEVVGMMVGASWARLVAGAVVRGEVAAAEAREAFVRGDDGRYERP